MFFNYVKGYLVPSKEEPIIVRPHPTKSGQYIVVDGVHRLRDFKAKKGLKDV